MKQTEISNRELDSGKRVILFWIRHEIDLDSSTPVIAKLAEHSSLKIQCVVINLRETFEDDWWIIYLRSLSVDVMHAYQLLKISPVLAKIALGTSSSRIGGLSKRLMRIFYNRLILAPVLRYLKNRVENLDLVTCFSSSKEILPADLAVFDETVNETYRKLCFQLRQQSVPTVSIPHAPNFAMSVFEENLGVDLEGIHPHNQIVDIKIESSLFDIQSLSKKREHYLGQLEQEHTVLGSTRYAPEWIERLDSLIAPYKFPHEFAPKLRVVLMLAKIKYPLTDLTKTNRLVKIFSDLPDVQLVLKPHPRDYGLVFPQSVNVVLADSQVSSSALIRWADLVLFTHTSIVLEAVVRDKPVGYLKYLVTSPPLHEHVQISWAINGEDELEALVSQFLIGEKVRTYSIQERDGLLKTVVCPKGKNVLELYARFLVGQLS
ncbi:MAG: hypothetical protein HOK99_07590 [Betaproteobacteria bacterium]|jgi:hypothetical protein|nr:hypothetical protein [Betaproteobacteria bacterium]